MRGSPSHQLCCGWVVHYISHMDFIKEITKPIFNITFETIEVEAESRKLRAVWSPQLAQDLAAFKSIDISKQLENVLVDGLVDSIDKQIIKDIIGGVHYFNEITQASAEPFLPITKQVCAKTIASELVEAAWMVCPLCGASL